MRARNIYSQRSALTKPINKQVGTTSRWKGWGFTCVNVEARVLGYVPKGFTNVIVSGITTHLNTGEGVVTELILLLMTAWARRDYTSLRHG
jgi:hypothetical protein